MKTDRILNILYYLNRYKKVSAKKLSEEFEVSQRTIYRDLDILENMGIPIERKMGFEGGISIIENFKLENINFSKSELTRIIEILNNYYYKDSKTKLLLEKFKNIISEKEIEAQKKMDYFKIEEGNIMDKKEQKDISVLKKSIENKNIINLEYINNNNEKSQREIEPYVISIKGNIIYLFAYCLLKKELRIFRISRILKMNITNRKYNERKEVLEEIYSNKEFFKFDNNDEIIMKYKGEFFETAKLFLGEDEYDILDKKTYHPKNKKTILRDTDILIKLRWRTDKWLVGFILNMGDNVEILEPESLREEITNKVQELYALYFKGENDGDI